MKLINKINQSINQSHASEKGTSKFVGTAHNNFKLFLGKCIYHWKTQCLDFHNDSKLVIKKERMPNFRQPEIAVSETK